MFRDLKQIKFQVNDNDMYCLVQGEETAIAICTDNNYSYLLDSKLIIRMHISGRELEAMRACKEQNLEYLWHDVTFMLDNSTILHSSVQMSCQS